MKIHISIQNSLVGGHRQTDRQAGDLISPHDFLENMLKTRFFQKYLTYPGIKV
jgi:hypothetical protein